MANSSSDKASNSIEEAWLLEAKTDLRLSAYLAESSDVGFKRRRLFFLQQAVEKCVKSAMPRIAMSMLSIPFFSSLHLVGPGPKGFAGAPQKPLDVLLGRGERIFTSFQRPKELTHNPSKVLDVKSFLEDCYLFAMSVENIRWMEFCLRSTHIMEHEKIRNVLVEIEGAVKQSNKISSEAGGILGNPREITPWKANAMIEKLQDSAMNDVKLSCLELVFLALLSRHEQASRYPEIGIPGEVIECIPLIQVAVEQMIERAEKDRVKEMFDVRGFLLEYGRPFKEQTK